jgi:hypothetical protein
MKLQNTADAAAPLENRLRKYGKSVLAMTLLGSVFGAMVGILLAPPGPIGLVAGGLAGLVVLMPLGMVLGMAGGRWQEMLWCGAIGLALGILAGAVGDPARIRLFAAIGLVYGAIVGATFVTVFFRLPRLVVGLLRTRVWQQNVLADHSR